MTCPSPDLSVVAIPRRNDDASESAPHCPSDEPLKGRATATSNRDRSASTTRESLGTYGLGIRGLDGARRLLSRPDADDPDLLVTVERSSTQVDRHQLEERRARYRLQTGGCILIDRASAHARYVFPPDRSVPTPEELVHPFLFAAAATLNHWHGRQTFHAGAFHHDGGAWVVAGDKEAGKSSMLGWLALNGFKVLADDLVVVDGQTVLAGPATVDLRPDAAKRFGVGECIGVVGTRERWRYVVPSAPLRTPLRGWVFPCWGDDISVSGLRITDRLRQLFASQAILTPPNRPDAMVTLSAAPAFRFVRPKSWPHVDQSMWRLIDELTASRRPASQPTPVGAAARSTVHSGLR